MAITYKEATRQRQEGVRICERYGLKKTKCMISSYYCYSFIFNTAIEEKGLEKVIEILAEIKNSAWNKQFLARVKNLPKEVVSKLQAIEAAS